MPSVSRVDPSRQWRGTKPAHTTGMDVYSSSVTADWMGIWDNDVVEEYTANLAPGLSPHTLSVVVDNVSGVLDRVTGVIARRGYNIQVSQGSLVGVRVAGHTPGTIQVSQGSLVWVRVAGHTPGTISLGFGLRGTRPAPSRWG